MQAILYQFNDVDDDDDDDDDDDVDDDDDDDYDDVTVSLCNSVDYARICP